MPFLDFLEALGANLQRVMLGGVELLLYVLFDAKLLFELRDVVSFTLIQDHFNLLVRGLRVQIVLVLLERVLFASFGPKVAGL